MVRNTKEHHIIQAPSGTDLSTIRPKLPKTATLVPLKHRMFFGGKTYRYFVPNDGFEYFLFRRNNGGGILASTLQERLGNEEWAVRDVLGFGEKEVSHKKNKNLKKKLKGKDKKRDALTGKFVVEDVFDFGEEEEILHKKEKKLKQELQEKDQKIFVLTEQIKVKFQEIETLQKILLQNLVQQVHKARKEHLKRFQEEEFAQDMDMRFY